MDWSGVALGMCGAAIIMGILLLFYGFVKICVGKKVNWIKIIYVAAVLLIVVGFVGLLIVCRVVGFNSIGDLMYALRHGNFAELTCFFLSDFSVIAGVTLQISTLIRIYTGKKTTKVSIDISIIFMFLFFDFVFLAPFMFRLLRWNW